MSASPDTHSAYSDVGSPTAKLPRVSHTHIAYTDVGSPTAKLPRVVHTQYVALKATVNRRIKLQGSSSAFEIHKASTATKT